MMKNRIDIEHGSRYWDRAWSLVDGCTPCSPGCDHCWSAAMARRFHKFVVHPNGRFNGEIITRPDRLSIPLKTRKPTVFSVWNDLFHEAVPDEFIDSVYQVMTIARRHTFLILSKRSMRQGEYHRKIKHNIGSRYVHRNGLNDWRDKDRLLLMDDGQEWPLSNVWHGLTVCNQEEADSKIPVFLQVPGKKFLSIEPMLGAIDLLKYPIFEECVDACPMPGLNCSECHPYRKRKFQKRKIEAVILGGETGPGARPLHPEWVRSVRDQCAAAGVPFLFKQWGEWIVASDLNLIRARKTWNSDRDDCCWLDIDGTVKRGASDGLSQDAYAMIRVPRKFAGRLLDGRTHDDLPWHKEV